MSIYQKMHNYINENHTVSQMNIARLQGTKLGDSHPACKQEFNYCRIPQGISALVGGVRTHVGRRSFPTIVPRFAVELFSAVLPVPENECVKHNMRIKNQRTIRLAHWFLEKVMRYFRFYRKKALLILIQNYI